MSKVLNFDKFIQEKNKETIDVTVFGKVYTVKAEVPAIVPVMMARAESESDQQAATKAIIRAADSMFGTKAIDEMCANGISSTALSELVQKLFLMINGADATDDESEELDDSDSRVAAPNTGKGKK